MPRKKDDSNKFVVSITAFNRLQRDPLILITLLAVLAMYGHWLYERYARRS